MCKGEPLIEAVTTKLDIVYSEYISPALYGQLDPSVRRLTASLHPMIVPLGKNTTMTSASWIYDNGNERWRASQDQAAHKGCLIGWSKLLTV
jgi:hypothetical protein